MQRFLSWLKQVHVDFEFHYRTWSSETEYFNQYDKRQTPINRVRFCYECAPNELRGWTNRQLCKYLGHRMVGTSYGGRESGAMAGHCERCGFSFHHTLY